MINEQFSTLLKQVYLKHKQKVLIRHNSPTSLDMAEKIAQELKELSGVDLPVSSEYRSGRVNKLTSGYTAEAVSLLYEINKAKKIDKIHQQNPLTR